MNSSIPGSAEGRPHLQVADPARLRAAAEDDAWSRFSQADNAEAFCQAWLAVTCIKAGAVDGILVLAQPGGGGYVPAAVWPDSKRDRAKLGEAIERAIQGNALIAVPAGDDGSRLHVAQPIQADGAVLGAVGVDVDGRGERELQRLARELAWGAGWLEALLRRHMAAGDSATAARLRQVFDVFSAALEHHGFVPAATATVTELASLLDCDRISLGIQRGKRSQVKALSHTVQFEKNAELTRAIETAMDEAVDQKSRLVWPPEDGVEGHVLRAHEKLAQVHGAAAILTVPLTRMGEGVGALCLERARVFTHEDVELAEGLAALLGPLIEIQRAADRGPIARIRDALKDVWFHFFGPGHAAWKLTGLVIAALTIFFAVATGTYRLAADTRVEGAIQRALAAPFEGYIGEAAKRPGDLVKQGEAVARLEDRDLQLERTKLASRREQLYKQYREALANHERADIRVIGSQVEQADAELAIVEEKLTRTAISAPFDGVVVSGDLTQKLGAPVQRGDVLFEIAPLEDYRVVLKVDERDIRDVAVGQHGELVLQSMPSERQSITVARVTPVSTPEDGRNYFRVEAKLDHGVERLRPGMEGVGKISVGERKLIWIWTRYLLDWARLQLWSVMP
ncbi:MAG: HlyD family efflux transporter periplasmic adaptor subunit [Betaproteobacteria bacterium]